MAFETVELASDILIIGGGCAGAMAAIEAHHLMPSAHICVMEKGHVKRSGSVTTGMDAMNVITLPGLSSPADYVQAMRKECDGILDDTLSYTLAAQSYEVLKLLESWGVFFPKDADGQYYLLQIGENGSKKYGVGMDEPDLKQILERKLRDTGCTIFNNTMVTDIIVADNTVLGAVGLNLSSNQVTLCRAKAVILANGSAARFGLPGSGYLYGTFDFPGNSGDGFSLALRAGARLTAMEYTLTTPLVKDISAPILNVTLNRGALIVDGSEKVRYTRSDFSLRGLRDAIYRGEGPFYLKTDHLPPDLIMEIENVLFSTERPMQRRFFEQRGIKLGRDLIELCPTEAQLCGGHGLSGVVIDQQARTSVWGLFAAGDVSAVAMQFLTGAFVFGRIAAAGAMDYLGRGDRLTTAWTEKGQAVLKRLQHLLSQENGQIEHWEYEYRIRKIINDYCVSPKNARFLRHAIDEVNCYRERLPDTLKIDNLHGLCKALEIQAILDCAHMSALSSLTREESRWGSIHQRIDFPEKNDDLWLKHLDITQSMYDSELQISFREIKGAGNE